MKILIALSWFAAFCLSTAGWTSEVSFAPIPAYSPEAQAVREGAAFRRQGDQLHEEAPAEKVREAWQAAVDAYHRAGYHIGEVELLFQIASSYQAEIMSGPEAVPRMFEAMTRGAMVSAEFLDSMARSAGSAIPAPDPETDALLREGLDFVEAGDCVQGLPVLEAARTKHAERGAATGELRALAGRLYCLRLQSEDPMSFVGFMLTQQDFARLAQSLQGKLKAGPAVRYLRAVESTELGKLEEAETLLRAVLPELAAAGDRLGAGLAALDLGYVLLQRKKPGEAEPFLKQARDVFAGRKDPESRRNREGAEENLASLHSMVARGPEKPQESGIGPAAEIFEEPLPPEPAGLLPRARARREAAFLLGQGDRLESAGRLRAAREKWQAAAEAYRRGEDSWELSLVYLRLAKSFASGSVTDPKRLWLYLDYFDLGLAAYAEAYEGSVQKELSLSAEDLAQADDLRRQAARRIEAGDCTQALPLLSEARKLYHRAGLALGEVRSLVGRARCLARSGDGLGALGAFIELLPLVNSVPSESPASELRIQADELFEQGRWLEAREAFRDLLCRSERDGDVPQIAQALLGLGKVEKALSNPAEAEALIERSLSLLPLVDEELDETREGSALEALGDVYFSTGRLDEGIAAFGKARRVFERAGRPQREARSLRHLAMGLLENADYAAAFSVLGEAAALQKLLPQDPEADGDLVTIEALVEFLQGKPQNALSDLFKAQDAYRKKGSVRRQSAVLLLQGGVQSFLGREEEAEELRRQAQGLGGLGDSPFFSQIGKFGDMALLVQHEKYQEIIDLGRDLLSHVEGGDDGVGAVLIRSLLAMSYLNLGRREEARAELDAISRALPEGAAKGTPSGLDESVMTLMTTYAQALERIYALQEEAREKGLSGAPLNDPRVLELLRGFAGSIARDVKALENASRTLGPTSGFGAPGFRLVENLASQDPEGSLESANEMIDFADRLAEGLTLGELKGPFVGQFSPLYSGTVALSLSAGRPEEAFRFAEEARARAFADQIGNQRIDARQGADPVLLREERRIRLQLNRLKQDLEKEQRKALAKQSRERLDNLQSGLEKAEQEWKELILRLKIENSEYAALVSADPVDLEEVRTQVLDGETTLIEYFVSGDDQGGVFAWVIEREGFEMIQLPIPSGDLRNRVTELRALIEARGSFRPQAAALYRDLFAPLAPYVTHRHLIVVPHGVLHFLPFPALWDEKGDRFLGDGWMLSFAPSATVLKFIREKTAKPKGFVLAIGNPDGTLSHAAEEARAVARLYGAEPLVGREATESAVLSRASEAGILHLAAHADLNPINPLFTSIKLAPDGEHDGSLEMHEVYGLDLSKTGLVVLSACSTQMGRLSRGDEIEGLTRAFLYAGTPAVVSSLWKVDDESSAFFMERFHTHLRNGEGRAAALQKAQVETRGRFPHPYHWAAFVLTGDGR